MSGDELVTVPVEMTREGVERWAKRVDGPFPSACRAWLADNPEPEPEPEPEREVLGFGGYRDGYWTRPRWAVPVEALRPGDRVGGRVVESVDVQPDGFSFTTVRFGNERCHYSVGTLVLLDPEDGDR